jgi:hypothetical protein
MKPEVFKHRRQRLMADMRQRGGGVAVLFTSAEVARNRDSDFPFRWDSYFYYMRGRHCLGGERGNRKIHPVLPRKK